MKFVRLRISCYSIGSFFFSRCSFILESVDLIKANGVFKRPCLLNEHRFAGDNIALTFLYGR